MMEAGSTLHYPVNVSGYEAADYLCTEMCSTCFQPSGRTVVASTTHTSPLSSFPGPQPIKASKFLHTLYWHNNQCIWLCTVGNRHQLV